MLRVIGSTVVVSSLAAFAPTAGAQASVFGKTTVGGTWGGGFIANLNRANAYSHPRAGTVAKLSIHLAPLSVRGSVSWAGNLGFRRATPLRWPPFLLATSNLYSLPRATTVQGGLHS